MKGRITILGAGISGKGAALLAASKGYSVFVSDLGNISASTKAVFEAEGIEFEENNHNSERILQSDEIIKSPGIPPKSPIIHEAVLNNIPVIDELEFAGRYLKKPCILITGTNGKTTTTLLTAHLLNTCGINAAAVGNVGASLAEALVQDNADAYVVECSSFQLDGMKEFRADAVALLNITPDHLDRYGSMEAYVESKMRISQMIKEGGWFIYNALDPNISPMASEIRAFSLNSDSYGGILDGDFIIDGHTILPVSDLSLKGDHNKLNALAASIACSKIVGIQPEIAEGLRTFKAVAHRLEWVENIEGIDFVNDSKATNVEAVQYALDSFENPLVWIAGGIDKGNNYSQIQDQVSRKVHSLVCLGVDNAKLKAEFSDIVLNLSEASNMKEAIEHAWKYAKPEDVVLLSPACASFDLFNNYEDRGEQFRTQVMNLKETVEGGTYE